MLVIWNSMIQIRLDYCSQLWSPSQAADIAKLENVQRQFTKRIHGMEDKSYRERLKDLGMYSQERRRDRRPLPLHIHLETSNGISTRLQVGLHQ